MIRVKVLRLFKLERPRYDSMQLTHLRDSEGKRKLSDFHQSTELNVSTAMTKPQVYGLAGNILPAKFTPKNPAALPVPGRNQLFGYAKPNPSLGIMSSIPADYSSP